MFFNAIIGARLGVFYYGRVIPGLALWEGTKHQYPLYDALAMGVQMMVFTYLLGRTDPDGRTVIDMWADSRSKGRLQSSLLSVVAVVVIGHVMYAAVFAPHLVTKLSGEVTAGPTEELFEGMPNQPLHGRCERPMRSKDEREPDDPTRPMSTTTRTTSTSTTIPTRPGPTPGRITRSTGTKSSTSTR